MQYRNPFDSRRRAALLGLAGSAASVVLGPFASLAHAAAQTPAIAPQRGGRLTLLVNPEPNVLINFATTAGAEQKVSPKVTEGLLSYDFNVQPQPQLATAWAISADGLQYTFRLRQGVRWHDGQPFTSKDVATSIGLLKQYHSRGRTTFANVLEVRTSDPHTAVLQLSKPAPYLIYALAASESPIVPAHLYDSGDPLNNPHNIAPIGTGPYRFKSWERGSNAVFVRNPDYWDAPKPYIDELVLRFIGDPAARAVELETGELDLAGENPVPLLDIQRLQALPHLALESRGYSYDAAQTQLQFNLDNHYLANPKVRQAIAHTIDREAILRTVWYGYGIVAPSPISPLLTQFYDPHAPSWPHDPARAEKLLDEAGFPRQSNGFRFALNVDFNPYDPTFARLAEYLRQTCAARVSRRRCVRRISGPTSSVSTRTATSTWTRISSAIPSIRPSACSGSTGRKTSRKGCLFRTRRTTAIPRSIACSKRLPWKTTRTPGWRISGSSSRWWGRICRSSIW
ncbi:MAG: ABC transporter substrate-binding protein [Paraburkholderia sp.]|uniref:ABC transporter substrate-binding protein n=1 Tax=Paraburkholderia sp. TaxID=1926495 RepID=UPI003979E321